MSSPSNLSQSVAAELRAEMARQRKTTTDLAYALKISQSSASLRYSGKQTLTLDEVGIVAEWLGVPLTALLAAHARRAAS